MPIHREQFDAMEEGEKATTSERIVAFLYENRNQAFTRGEIAEAIDQNPNTVATNLTRLKKRGLLEHKDKYWAITADHERIADALQFSGMLSTLNDKFGPLIENEANAQAWAETQPDGPHPSDGTG